MNPIIKELDDSGQLLRLLKGGFISYKIMRNKDIYLTFDVHRKTGKGYNQSIRDTADQFDLSDRQIENIIAQMK
jgi:hypothetical protein